LKGRLILLSDGLNGAVPWITQTLNAAGLNVQVISRDKLVDKPPADAVLLRFLTNPVETCWRLHQQGHRAIVAISPEASSRECIRLLNAGADYYLDAWMPAAELVDRIRVALKFSGWLRGQPAARQPAWSTPQSHAGT
jgi:DNA-binding response OmpR family regulator